MTGLLLFGLICGQDDIDLSMSGGDIRRPVAPSEGQSDYFDVVMQGDGLMHRLVCLRHKSLQVSLPQDGYYQVNVGETESHFIRMCYKILTKAYQDQRNSKIFTYQSH